MKKDLSSNDNNVDLSFDDINSISGKSELKTFFIKFQDKLNLNLIKYRKCLIYNFNEFQIDAKILSQSVKENLKATSESFKERFNEEYTNEIRANIIPIFHAQCEMMKNTFNEQYNLFKEERISKLQTASDNILKGIDEYYFTCEEELKSIISIEPAEYKKNIIELINKFKDEMNLFLVNLIKKMNYIFNSFQTNYLSMMNSFQHEINDYIRFGNGKRIENHKCRE